MEEELNTFLKNLARHVNGLRPTYMSPLSQTASLFHDGPAASCLRVSIDFRISNADLFKNLDVVPESLEFKKKLVIADGEIK